jgi:putative transport protein
MPLQAFLISRVSQGDIMLGLLEQSPLLLLFLVAGIGYPIGRLKLAGFSLGVSAVLFTGLVFGSLSSELKLPEVVYQFGLVLFVYTIGLSSGPGFFAALRRKGLRDNLFALGILFAAGAVVALASLLFKLGSWRAAGLFAGALTNTPALAGVLETLKSLAPKALLEQMLVEPVVAYSVAYPIGVIGMLLAIGLFERLWKVDQRLEASRAPELKGSFEGITHQSVMVTASNLQSQPIAQIAKERGWHVVFGRYQHANNLTLVSPETRLQPGDVISLVGSPSEVSAVMAELGEPSAEALELNRSNLDFRRVVVSNPNVAGKSLNQLELPQHFGAIITRVGRGDVDLLPNKDFKLELGDRVRVVCAPDQMNEVAKALGDSYRAISEIDVMTFSVGIALGLLLGAISLPLPGGSSLKLGIAGGPLIVGLILGALGRTGSVVWQLPHSANLTLRQLGVILFLAGVGTRSGFAFVSTFAGGGGVLLFVIGALVTCFTAFLTLWVGYKILKISFPILTGMLAGIQTQPAVLAFAVERAQNDLPNIGYSSVYPMAMIGKILIAQLLLTLLR